jgi:hypothetical protein
MRPRKNTTLILFLSLLLAAFTAVSAQTPSQGGPKDKSRELLLDGIVLLL